MEGNFDVICDVNFDVSLMLDGLQYIDSDLYLKDTEPKIFEAYQVASHNWKFKKKEHTSVVVQYIHNVKMGKVILLLLYLANLLLLERSIFSKLKFPAMFKTVWNSTHKVPLC